MSYEDKTLTCVECGGEFAFTAAEQELFSSRGFSNDPKRCLSCRQTRRSSREGGEGGYRPPRQMYPAVCAQCGKETEVPFQPRGDRPVYCSECFSQVRLNQER